METSPRRTWLYRTGAPGVILLAASMIAAAQGTISQYGRKQASTGPRALGLIQVPSNGKAHLFPIAIMVDGKFYDAGSYKGTPVPMALDFDVVYEGFRSGISQGLFVVTQPGKLHSTWIAEGAWLPEGIKPTVKGMKYETPKVEDKDAPPRLHRGDVKPAEPAAAEKPAPPPAPAPSTPKPPEAAKVVEPPRPFEDANRPILRRGKPDPAARHEGVKDFDKEEPLATPSKGRLREDPNVQIIPAISDAGGPDARSFVFDLRPGEEAQYRQKMLELASSALRAKGRADTQDSKAVAGQRRVKTAAKTPAATFDDVHMRIFDLSSSNEPVLVLSATARPTDGSGVGEEITLVARTNLEGEVRRLYFSQTNSRQLDLAPRMEVIDAVDADGDGRAELLFRTMSDAGSSYAIYRVTADRLWPLYEGTP